MTKRKGQKRDGVFTKAGRMGYYISWVDASGQQRQRKTDAANLAEARQIRADELRRAEQSRVLGFTIPGKVTFEKIADEYLDRQTIALTPAALRRESDILRMYLKPFFAGALADVRHAKVQKYLMKRTADGAAPATVRKELQILKHLFRFAVQCDYLPSNPAAEVRGPKEPAGRVRYLQVAELRLVLDACPVWLKPVAALAVTTGMRQGEILALRPMDLDLGNRVAILPRTKNGDSRTVPLNDAALMVLQAVAGDGKRSPTAKLFDVGMYNRVSVAFSRACRSAGIPDFRFHDLRHTFASHARMAGVDIHTLALLLGHKNLKMTARYSHLSPAFMAQESARAGAVFAGVLMPENPGNAVGTNGPPNLLTAANSSSHPKTRKPAKNAGEMRNNHD